MISIKKSLGLFFFVLICTLTPLSAVSLRISLGSFVDQNKALQQQEKLQDNGVVVWIVPHTLKGVVYHRLITQECYATIKAAAQRIDRWRESGILKRLGISRPWILDQELPTAAQSRAPAIAPQAAHPKPAAQEPLPAVLPETSVVSPSPSAALPLAGAPVAALPLVPQTPAVFKTPQNLPWAVNAPYLVLIQSYRSLGEASELSAKLKEINLSNVVVKKYSSGRGPSFVVCSDTFETSESAQDLTVRLQTQGLPDAQSAEWTELADEVRAYDALSEEQKTEYIPAKGAQTRLPATVQAALSAIKVNQKATVIYLTIADGQGLQKALRSPSSLNLVNGVFPENFAALLDQYKPQAAAQAVYEETLTGYRTSLAVFVFEQPEKAWAGLLEPLNIGWQRGEPVTLNLASGPIVGVKVRQGLDGQWNFWGYQEKTGQVFYYTPIVDDVLEWEAALGRGPSIAESPEVFRGLAILPEPHSAWDFISYHFDRVDAAFAAEKNYTLWAQSLVGTGSGRLEALKDGQLVATSFYDLRYPFEAERVQNLFLKEKSDGMSWAKANGVESLPTSVDGRPAWYLAKPESHELSVSFGSYVAAVSSYSGSLLPQDSLAQWVKSLGGWTSVPADKTAP